jgi:hypothetical protein
MFPEPDCLALNRGESFSLSVLKVITVIAKISFDSTPEELIESTMKFRQQNALVARCFQVNADYFTLLCGVDLHASHSLRHQLNLHFFPPPNSSLPGPCTKSSGG